MMAAILAVTMTYFFSKRIRLSRSQHATTGIVAAVNDLPSGTTLTAKDVALVEWPTNMALAGAFDKVDDVVGKPLLYPLVASEPILKRDLGLEGSGIGISGKIPTGMRATAVRSNEIVGVAGFLYPGSRVDVMVTYTPPGGGSGGPVTQTVLQNVEVLTAGQTIEPDPQGKPQTVNVVTLLVSQEDSQKLQLASSQGVIQFVLRSGVDQKNVDLHPTHLDQLAGDKPPAPPPVAGKKMPKKIAEASKPVYIMEVIQGTKRTEEKF